MLFASLDTLSFLTPGPLHLPFLLLENLIPVFLSTHYWLLLLMLTLCHPSRNVTLAHPFYSISPIILSQYPVLSFHSTSRDMTMFMYTVCLPHHNIHTTSERLSLLCLPSCLACTRCSVLICRINEPKGMRNPADSKKECLPALPVYISEPAQCKFLNIEHVFQDCIQEEKLPPHNRSYRLRAAFKNGTPQKCFASGTCNNRSSHQHFIS